MSVDERLRQPRHRPLPVGLVSGCRDLTRQLETASRNARQFPQILFKPHLKNWAWDVLMTREVTTIGQEPQTVEGVANENRG